MCNYIHMCNYIYIIGNIYITYLLFHIDCVIIVNKQKVGCFCQHAGAWRLMHAACASMRHAGAWRLMEGA